MVADLAIGPDGTIYASDPQGGGVYRAPPGATALEALVARHCDGWCFGNAPTLADCYLIPQIYSARRFNVPLEAFARLLAIDTLASQHSAFIAAHPDAQPDAD
jgi:maleylpyruvate isomerase